MSRQSLTRLRTIQATLGALAIQSKGIVQNQIQTVAILQAALDQTNSPMCKDQCEKELRVSSTFIKQFILFLMNYYLTGLGKGDARIGLSVVYAVPGGEI